jgi:hypothetical protein
LRKPPWVKCPKCGQYGRLYVLKIKRTGGYSFEPFVQHGFSRHFIKRMMKREVEGGGDGKVKAMMMGLSEYAYFKLMGYLSARRFGVPAVDPYKNYQSDFNFKAKILDDFEPPRALPYSNTRNLHLEALNRLEQVLEFHGWWCMVRWGLLWAIPPGWDYALKFYVKVGLDPIVRLDYDFDKSALAVLKLKKFYKNGRAYYEGRWFYTPLYELQALKGSVVRVSKLPLYPLTELIENVKGMSGSNVVGV